MELHSALTVRDASFTYQAGAEYGIGAEALLGRGTATEPGSEAGFGTAAGVAGPALKNVSLDIPAGKMTVIAGRPGLARVRWQTSCSVYSRPARAGRALTACPWPERTCTAGGAPLPAFPKTLTCFTTPYGRTCGGHSPAPRTWRCGRRCA